MHIGCDFNGGSNVRALRRRSRQNARGAASVNGGEAASAYVAVNGPMRSEADDTRTLRQCNAITDGATVSGRTPPAIGDKAAAMATHSK